MLEMVTTGPGRMAEPAAIVAAIGNTNVSEVALVAAIRADVERVGGKLHKAMKAAQSAEDQTA